MRHLREVVEEEVSFSAGQEGSLEASCDESEDGRRRWE